ncbi:MAG: Uma2 family endonuclease [Dehalococcoidia bacterium]|nr:Uma2 family endonuclease [Dehalococcoidia bacterium]
MTTTTKSPPLRRFTSAECDAMAAAGIITLREADSLAVGRRFTVSEYYALGEAGILCEDERIELLDGEIIIMPPIGDNHEFSTDELNMMFVPPLVGRARVRVQGSVVLNDNSMPQPDLAILANRLNNRVAPYYPSEVYLLIEVADSSLSYDRGRKLSRYASSGVPEVWIVNLRSREVVSYADPEGSAYTTVRAFRPGESISPRAFPDVVLAVDAFLPPTDEGQ